MAVYVCIIEPGSLSSKDVDVIPKVDSHDNVTITVMINLQNTDVSRSDEGYSSRLPQALIMLHAGHIWFTKAQCI